MVKILFLLLFPFVLSAQWVMTPDGMKKLGSTTVGDSIIISAQATVDSLIFVTKTNLDSVKSNRSLIGHTHQGGSDPWTVYRRMADSTKSTNALVNIGGMQFNVTNGTAYSFRFILIYQAGATTTGFRSSITVPAGTIVASVQHFGHAADGVGTPWAGTINASADIVTSTAVAAANVNYLAIVEGTFIAGANGLFSMQWAPEVAAAATLKAGSIMMYRAIP